MNPRRKRSPPPKPATPTSSPEPDSDEAASLRARADAAMGARDGRAMAALLSSATIDHLRGHAKEFHDGLRPVFAVFARSPTAEGLFRRFLPAALDPARATGAELAATEAEASMQRLVQSMVTSDRDMAEIFDAALRMLDPLVGASVDDVLHGLLSQLGDDLAADTPSPDGERHPTERGFTREDGALRLTVHCPHCPPP